MQTVPYLACKSLSHLLVFSLYSEAIYATEFDVAYTATLEISGETAHTVTYSVNSYVKSMHSDDSIGDLAKALYFYGAASKAYATFN